MKNEQYANNSPLARAKAIVDAKKTRAKKLEQAGEIYIDAELLFAKYTALTKADMTLLYFGVALHAARIYFVNKLLATTKANKDKGVEKWAKDKQKESAKLGENMEHMTPHEYYAPLKQIYEGRGVPYDATTFDTNIYPDKTLQPRCFKHVNHRFSTLGHYPLLGLVFGTSNIITNTITVRNSDNDSDNNDKDILSYIPVTYHVNYDDDYKNPRIGAEASTLLMFSELYERVSNSDEGEAVLKAGLKKQALHIISDMFTTAGIPIPVVGEVLEKRIAEAITKYVGFGDIVKNGIQALLAWIIDLIISLMHQVMRDENKDPDEKLYSVRTAKIVNISNLMASGSSVVSSALKAYATKNPMDLKDADFGGLLVVLTKIYKSQKLQKEIKREYIVKYMKQEIIGNEV